MIAAAEPSPPPSSHTEITAMLGALRILSWHRSNWRSARCARRCSGSSRRRGSSPLKSSRATPQIVGGGGREHRTTCRAVMNRQRHQIGSRRSGSKYLDRPRQHHDVKALDMIARNGAVKRP
ncbi:hypothetical protein HBB16_08385 [Pseudonocardia sp. MCCB 268]|nr:hypothetical protein [Pseudonocardia cytotoxica]